ncbi:MAG: tRNA (adenosine(37)-N6)-threonylcarbamoyltransferase complex ATPase subunit type 1 TsaE [bacterium]
MLQGQRQRFTSPSAEETIRIAAEFAATIRRGDVIALYGDLGTGKTQFVKGVCSAFNVRGSVSSPTFVLLNRYEGVDPAGEELLIYHLDLYRTRSLEEIYDLGYEEFFFGQNICLIEWADQVEQLLPVKHYAVHLMHGEHEYERQLSIEQIEKRS